MSAGRAHSARRPDRSAALPHRPAEHVPETPPQPAGVRGLSGVADTGPAVVPSSPQGRSVRRVPHRGSIDHAPLLRIHRPGPAPLAQIIVGAGRRARADPAGVALHHRVVGRRDSPRIARVRPGQLVLGLAVVLVDGLGELLVAGGESGAGQVRGGQRATGPVASRPTSPLTRMGSRWRCRYPAVVTACPRRPSAAAPMSSATRSAPGYGPGNPTGARRDRCGCPRGRRRPRRG